ncbi:uncharacterized protein LOC111639575 [Centruroides sculpturatus]|uniref:uncharacterized protein LOC111616629 n=1 Tax=Centruroides sculpturatus TaxID=218467 RepID=UPI000C6EBB35|nr:uncharacterized protein LOC111616629 [Centruroides sculpturatus]XP_023241228.1 uncharacterized protein LOC111639575 [Centruroides sculpturatus]
MEENGKRFQVICQKAKELFSKTLDFFTKFTKNKDGEQAVLSANETTIQNDTSNEEQKSLLTTGASFRSEFQKSFEQRILATRRKDDKYGSIAVALLCLATRAAGLLLCIIYLTSPKTFSQTNLKNIHLKVIKFVVLMCTAECSIVFIVSLLLICGILMKKKYLLIPWLTWTFLETACCLLAIIPLMIFAVKGLPWYPVVIWVCFVVPLISLHRSCASFVASHYYTLSERRHLPLSDIIIGKYGSLVLTDT